jgi:hypothetical protein
MKTHLFTSDCDGALYDTRVAEWSKAAPLRRDYCRTFAQIETLAQLKATLRAGGFAWPGGYPLYLIMSDCEPATFDAVRANWRGIVSAFLTGNARDDWRVIGCEVHWEGAALICAISGEQIESAYGNPDDESEASK